MAILKHKTSKNARYTDVLDYYQYKHHEDPQYHNYTPILDEFGLLQPRENYAVCYLDGHGCKRKPEEWARSCVDTNLRFGKNNTKNERKNHQYIISHPASDTPLLTKGILMEEGMAFVRENLQGYDALIAVHMDTDHYHVHISINSVRSVEREEQPWMMRNEDGAVLPCEIKAGGKHQNNPEFRRHCQEWLLNYSKAHGFTQEDNLQVEDQRKKQRYEERHERTKDVILNTASICRSFPELQKRLLEENQIRLVCRGKTLTVYLPNAKKGIRINRLGLTADEILSAMGADSPTVSQAQADADLQEEKRTYMDWLYGRRNRNNSAAEDLLADAACLIADKVTKSGRHYNKDDFRELRALVRQTVYLERDLTTELDKVDHLLEKWSGCTGPALSAREQQSCKSYIRWCGCNPDSAEDLRELQTERDVIAAQIHEAQTVRQALIESADSWKDQNDQAQFQYHLDWLIRKEDQLKHQLKQTKANRKKLSQIAYTCQKAAGRRIYKKEYLEKAAHYRQLWHDRLMQEKELKEQLRRIRQERAEAEKAKKHRTSQMR